MSDEWKQQTPDQAFTTRTGKTYLGCCLDITDGHCRGLSSTLQNTHHRKSYMFSGTCENFKKKSVCD